MTVFLDTGFLLAIKNKDDKNHEIAQNWMKRFLKNEFGPIYTSTFIFDELVTLALIRLKRKDIVRDIGNYVLNSPRINLINLTEIDFQESWDLFLKYYVKGLSFTDCSILVQSKRINCSFMATFDGHFKGLIGTILSK